MNNEKAENSRGHVMWSTDDRNQFLEEYKKSGKTKKAFCEERGINLGTFYGWAKKEQSKRKKRKNSKPAFKEISLPVAAAFPVEILLPGGARVCLRNTGGHEELAKLIRGVAGC